MYEWFELELDSRVLAEIPPPPIFVDAAARVGMDAETLLKHLMVGVRQVTMHDKHGVEHSMVHVPGHVFDGPYAPVPSSVMMIGKMPSTGEVTSGKLMSGPSNAIIEACMRKNGFGMSGVYVTNVLKFQLPQSMKKAPKEFFDFDEQLLLQELSMVRPSFILLMGPDATKAVLGNKATVGQYRSSIVERDGRKILVTINPEQLQHDPELRAGFEADMKLFCDMISNAGKPVQPPDTEYYTLKTLEEVRAFKELCLARGDTLFAMDCEWAGTGPRSANSYLRTIQISARPKEAAVIVLKDQFGTPVLVKQMVLLLDELRELLLRPGNEITGHYFRSDMAWLVDLGLDVRPYFKFDTSLASHILSENVEHGLEVCSVRHTDMGRYDMPLQQWVSTNIKKDDLAKVGYGTVPDATLIPYAACDADCTRRIRDVLGAALAADPALNHVFSRVVMPANLPILDMEMNGILVDPVRLVELREIYEKKKTELELELRGTIGKLDFNFRSPQQCQRLLFDAAPDGLGLVPIKTTDATDGMEWDVAIAKFQSGELKVKPQPSTDAESLRILSHQRPEARMLSDVKTIDQVTKNFLRPPDADGIYREGLLGLIDPDGRIRTHLSQMTETGRYRSYNPNLQNLPKKQESEVSRIFGETMLTIRSAFIASPGHVLVEADYKSAEVVVLGYLAGDKQLIHDALSGDIHSQNAVDLLGAKCKVSEVKKLFPAIRVGAKSLSFGIPYSRGKRAVAREIQKAGLDCTPDQAQRYIDAYFAKYTKVDEFLKFVKACVVDPGYVENPFGRRRRFGGKEVTDDTVLAAMEREAGNFPRMNGEVKQGEVSGRRSTPYCANYTFSVQ